jgi:hypothetical protein
MNTVTHLIQLSGIDQLRLLSAFQCMDMTAEFNMPKGYGGVSNKQACKMVEDLTGIKPKGKGRGRIQPEMRGNESDEALQRYLQWLVDTGTAVVATASP